MSSLPRRRAAFALLFGVLVAWQVDRWCFTPHGLPSTWSGRADRLKVSAGSPAGVVQRFTMGADGLDGMWLRASAEDRVPRGELVVDLLERRDAAPVRLERVAVPAADLVSASTYRVRFRPQPHSRGVAYEVRLRHLHIGDGPALDLAVTREDLLPDGRLFADGRERWGDLLFEASARRATLPYWLHEVFRGWPAWMRSWPVLALAVGLGNLLLAWACARAAGLTDSDAATPSAHQTAHGTAPSAAPTRRLAYGAAGAVALTGIVVALWPTPREPTLDLIDALPDAQVDTTWESVHGAVAFRFIDVLGVARYRTIHALPTTRLAWTVDVPPGAVFHAGATMRPDLWTAESDGIQMRVLVEHDDAQTVLTTLTLFPYAVPEHRRVVPVDLSLHPWAGRRVRLVLESTPERAGNAVNDVPVWVAPRLTWRRRGWAGEDPLVAP